MKFTKKEKERMQKAHKYIRNYKPKRPKKDIHIIATMNGKRRSVASGYHTIAQARKGIENIKKHKGEWKKLGYSNPRIKINPYK